MAAGGRLRGAASILGGRAVAGQVAWLVSFSRRASTWSWSAAGEAVRVSGIEHSCPSSHAVIALPSRTTTNPLPSRLAPRQPPSDPRHCALADDRRPTTALPHGASSRQSFPPAHRSQRASRSAPLPSAATSQRYEPIHTRCCCCCCCRCCCLGPRTPPARRALALCTCTSSWTVPV